MSVRTPIGPSEPEAILIAGPTASGKSSLALDLAGRHGGIVVNADSMQVYAGLRILTARPRPQDMAGIEHRLYGHADPAAPYSTGMWLQAVTAEIAAIRAAGRTPILVGGTGLYFKALLGGLDAMPPIEPALRERLRARHAAEGPGVLHGELARLDAAAAARLRPGDGQRVLRALELVLTTGRPLAELQAGRGKGPLDGARLRRIVLTPDRAALRLRIAQRFEAMVEEGAEAEALRFAAIAGAMEHSAGQAIGVREFLAAAEGRLTRQEAILRAITRTRQYAKRQETWFRNQFDQGWERWA